MKITAIYGPDGAGKTTFVDDYRREHALDYPGSTLMSLHGTRLEGWASTLKGLDVKVGSPPSPDDIAGRVAYASQALLALIEEGPDVEVIIDGLCVHKTLASVAIGGAKVADSAAKLGVIDVMSSISHAAINEGGTPAEDILYAHILQRRIHERGEPSKWDPVTVPDSLAQIKAYKKVEDWVEGLEPL